ncbi:hypothetical protein L5515_015463 [Caenorhabditis briggsae]|uniref:Carboxylesterase type B domain-containing protein n=1 Tax=Caenorhabditis briggsae TaxID=6238 RepID=A0AAE9EBV4_CAEBR|nr:hypothetical protein L5515_015463 [Caenorhabditis briggsae]
MEDHDAPESPVNDDFQPNPANRNPEVPEVTLEMYMAAKDADKTAKALLEKQKKTIEDLEKTIEENEPETEEKKKALTAKIDKAKRKRSKASNSKKTFENLTEEKRNRGNDIELRIIEMEKENAKMRKELGSDFIETSYKEKIEELKAKINKAKESKRKSQDTEKHENNGISIKLVQELKRKIREDYHLKKLFDSLKKTKEDNAELEEQIQEMEGNLNDRMDRNVMEGKVEEKYKKMYEKLRENEGKQRKIEDEMRIKLNELDRQQNFMDTPKNVSALTGCTKYEALSFDSYDDIGVSLGFQNPREVNVKYHQDQKNDQLGFSNKIRDETQKMLVQNKVKVDKLLQNGVPIYLYELTYPKHADHTDDLFYIMGVHPFELDENEKNIGKVYRTMFTNFIKTGEPGIGFERSDLRTSSFFDIYCNETSGDRPKMRTDFEESIMEYWTKEMVHFDQTISKTFLAGFLVAKYCCFRSQKNLYIQLDGNDYPIKNI